jgi:hypothetical protein
MSGIDRSGVQNCGSIFNSAHLGFNWTGGSQFGKTRISEAVLSRRDQVIVARQFTAWVGKKSDPSQRDGMIQSVSNVTKSKVVYTPKNKDHAVPTGRDASF